MGEERASCQGGGHSRRMEEYCGEGWEEDEVLWSWRDQPGAEQASNPHSIKKGKHPKVQMSSAFWLGSCYSCYPSATFPFLCNSSSKPYGSRIKVGGKYHLSPHNLKAGDLLRMAWGLALQPPSVNCSSSLLWPRWWWMATDKVQTKFTVCRCSQEQLWELAVSYWQMGQRKHPHSSFVHEKQKGQIISLTSHKMSAERGEQILLFLSPALHFKSETLAALIEAKAKLKKQENGLEKTGQTGSWLLLCIVLTAVKLLHRNTANGLEFKSEMKILAEV